MGAVAPLDDILALCRQGRLEDARRKLAKIVASAPRHADALHLLGLVHGRLGRHRDAIGALTKATTLAPRNLEAWLQLGDAAVALADTDAAVAAYDRAAALATADPRPHYNKGVALLRAGRRDAAAASLEHALAIAPGFAPGHSALGSLQADAGDAVAAVASHRRAIEIDAANPEFHNNLGVALDTLQRHDEALASFDRALALASSYGHAWSNRGIALHALHRLAPALASFDAATALDEADAEAWSNRALVLHDLRRFDEALASHLTATTLRPDDAAAWLRRAATENALRRRSDALASLDRAVAIDPRTPEAVGARLHTAMLLCDWRGFDAAVETLRVAARSGGTLVHPFAVLPTPLDAAAQRSTAERYAAAMHPPVEVALPMAEASPRAAGDARIRIGYYSSDFRDHAMMHLLAGLFERHDRSAFETIAFSFGGPSNDAMRERAIAAFDRFVDVTDSGDAAVAARSRELGIDIAVDLGGYTEGARPGIFAHRAAPIQVSYLGFPGTLGTAWTDYLVADAVVVPGNAHDAYTEKIVTLPVCYLCNEPWLAPSAPTVERAEHGLADQAFVFCCFNNSWKITPDVFAAWMRILARVPGSVLWLLQTDDVAEANLRREAAAHGIDAERLVFAPRMGRARHLERHAHADLVLDTFHYGAHTTASDALRTGVPVLTRTGGTFASRVATSLVATAGLAEMAVADTSAYEELAVQLAGDPARLAAMKSVLLDPSADKPLFDTARFARHLERAYVALQRRHLAGLPPADIDAEGISGDASR